MTIQLPPETEEEKFKLMQWRIRRLDDYRGAIALLLILEGRTLEQAVTAAETYPMAPVTMTPKAET